MREAYVKYTWRIAGLEVIVGLQWGENEDPRELRKELRARVAHAMTWPVGSDTFNGIREGVVRALDAGWPERSYFLEVLDDDDTEVQVYDPRGFMKARCDCPCKQKVVVTVASPWVMTTYCSKCGMAKEGGHERDGTALCWCAE